MTDWKDGIDNVGSVNTTVPRFFLASRLFWVGILSACFVALLSGCAAQPTASASNLEQLSTQTPRATRTPLPTSTPFPSRTPTVTATATSTATATGTPYAGIDYSQVYELFNGFLPGWRYFVALQFPVNVPDGDFYAMVDRNKRYDCYIYPQYPDRLYCAGPMVRTYDWASFVLYVNDIETPLLEIEFFSAIVPN